VIDVDGVVITVPNRIQAYMGDSYAKVVRSVAASEQGKAQS
jgi:hypothetical protein